VSILNILPSAPSDRNGTQSVDEARRSNGTPPMLHQSSLWFDKPSPVLEKNNEADGTNLTTRQGPQSGERLLNAREVAETLGVSERWVRDHTTRRSPKIRGIKLGTLVRYRRADVEVFMEKLDTQATSRQNRFGV
jgi:excisionase family DNA binding protein